MDILSAE